MQELYSEALLATAGALPDADRLENAMATSRKVSRVCGSEVTVDLCVADGRISDFAMQVKACALGQASAAIVSAHIIGEKVSTMRALQKQMWAMLRGEGPLPVYPGWASLKKLEPIKDYAARHASTMLIFDAVVDCLDQISAEE